MECLFRNQKVATLLVTQIYFESVADLNVGDQIMSIDGISADEFSHVGMLNTLRCAPDQVETCTAVLV